MKETIIYGGAFCPPTRAHQAILQACVDYAEPRDADVWLLPSADREDKTMALDPERRIELCRALCRDVTRRTVNLAINRTEIDRGRQTETYDTVRELEAGNADRAFTWVFGADSVASMRTWGHGDWLYDNLSILVIDRPGTPPIELGARAVRLQVDPGDMSSTELRRRMAAGEDYAPLVGRHVGALLAGAVV
jgi:nicotinate-nucleotide adenylyltransferase